MKIAYKVICSCLLFLQMMPAWGQDTPMNLQTRWTGQAPTHETPTSAAKWMQSPIAMALEIAVTNLYAATNAYLEVDVGAERQIFYGAGVDALGNYIPTNYPPIGVDASLQRQYSVNIVCPNSGPTGCPLFKLADISDPYGLGVTLSTSNAPAMLSAYLWTNFTAMETNAILNDDGFDDPGYLVSQTNLVMGLNTIITSGSLSNIVLLTGISLGADTTTLMAQNPQGQALIYLNRLFLRDAYGLPIPDASDNSGSAQITFFVNPPPEITISKVMPAPNYEVNITGPQSTQQGDSSQVLLINPGTGTISTNQVTLEITKDKFGHYALGDGCDDPRPGPGIGTWLTMGPGCTQDTNRISLDWSVGLGRTFDGLAFGRLCFRETSLSAEAYTPLSLYYEASDTNILSEAGIVFSNIATTVTNASGDIYTTTNLLIRQLMAYQAFVDVSAPDTNRTIIRFYQTNQVATNQDAFGVYTNITGSPFVTWTIQNPNPGTTNNLLITEQRAGGGSTSSLSKTASAGGVTWTLTQGGGATTRVETRQVSFAGTPPTNRVELDTVGYASSSSPCYQCQETYHFFAWGSELTETRVFNNPDYVTTYAYYDQLENATNAWNTYLNDLESFLSTNSAYAYYETLFEDPVMDDYYGYGQLKSIVYPDGYWEKRLYNNLQSGWMVDNDYPGGFDDLTSYSPGQLCFVFNPSVVDGITDVNGASIYTSLVTDYNYNSQGPGRTSDQWDDGGIMVHGGDVVEQYTNEAGPEGIVDYSINMQGYDPYSDYGLGEGSWEYIYADGSPNGLNGHTWLKLTWGTNETFDYYDHGIFDPIANTFSMDPNCHIYAFGVTNYPDHRATQIFSSGFEYGSSWMSDTLESHDVVDTSGGFPTGIPFNLFLTTKIDQIFHNGNLTQGEKYVCSGGSAAGPQWSLFSKVRYYPDSFGRPTNVVRIDGATGQKRSLYDADYRGANPEDGELLLSETDATGARVSYAYDSLKRVATIITNGYGTQPPVTVSLIYDANNQVLSRNVVSGGLSRDESWAYDLAGRLTNYVNTNGIATNITYSADNLTMTSTSPGGIVTTVTRNLDRTLASVQGNGVVAQFFQYGDGSDPASRTGLRFTTNQLGHLGAQRWQCTGKDALDQTAWTEKPVGLGNPNTIWKSDVYWPFGQLTQENCSAGFPSTRYFFDLFGNHNWQQSSTEPFVFDYYLTTAQILANGQVNTFFGDYRSKSSDIAYVLLNGNCYKATTNYVSLASDTDFTRTMASIHLDQINGFQETQIGGAIDFDADTNETLTTTTVQRSQNLVAQIMTEPAVSTLSATNMQQNGLLIQSSTFSVSAPKCYYYDPFGRTNQIKDSLGNSSYITYDPNTGWVTSQTDPAGNTTIFTYFGTNEANAGKLQNQAGPTGKSIYYSYTTCGQLFRTWGDVPYPSEYDYNEYGDLTNLITFRGGSGWSGSTWPSNPGSGDNTSWVYDDASGALLEKIDAQGNGPTYSYDEYSGRLVAQSWAREVGGNPVTATRTYDGYGDVVEQDYNDGTPSVQYNNFNRVGRPLEIVDASGTTELSYDYACRLVSVSGTSGIYDGVTLSNRFVPGYGRNALRTVVNSATLETDIAYDQYGRVGMVSSGTCSVVYGYLPNSDMLQTTTSLNGGSSVLTTTRQWDYGFRLRSIANVANGAVVTSHAYLYDALNRRTQATLEDGSAWNYSYNNRNELTAAGRSWSDGTSVTGQQYGYGFDNIGNRTNALSGSAGALRTTSYTANSLNEYTGITTPGYKDILGLAMVTNAVTVNGGTADRKGDYFHREVSISNNVGPIWQEVTNATAGTTITGGLLFPAGSQTVTYDVDGNLTFDGIWNYTWDAENRLIEMTMTNVAGVAPSNQLQLNFAYDYNGRRISKIVSLNSGSGFVPQTTNYFIYDGGNLVASFNPVKVVQQSFVWGLDVGGTQFGAGGVGGLIIDSVASVNNFVGYDGNGNISALFNATNGATEARYEYGPFGDLIRATGALANQNPFGFSTKLRDGETSLVYYGCRYYNPQMGRWIGRDPMAENGGHDLYGFCNNNAITKYDPSGKMVEDPLEAGAIGAGVDAEGASAAEGVLAQAEETVAQAEITSEVEVEVGLELTETGQGGRMTTIIGRMKDLEQFADDPSVDTWAKSGRIPGPGEPAVSWSENQAWLEQRIARGDLFGIATDPAALPPVSGGYIPGTPNGYFTARELDYLIGKGISLLGFY